MATAKKKTTRPTQEDDDALDDLEMPRPRGVPVKTTARSPRRRIMTREVDEELEDTPEVSPPVFRNANVEAIEKLIAGRVVGKPNFPYPPELQERYHPYWTEFVNSFDKGHFHVSDYTLLKVYCRCAYDIERCARLIETEGDLILDGRGMPMINPRIKIRKMAEDTLMTIATKFRAQPASRENTTNFKRKDGKAARHRDGEESIEDSDGLLAGAASRGSSHSEDYVN